MAAEEDIINLKCNLQKYRSLIIPLNKILEWEQNYYPGVVVGVLTFVFTTAVQEEQYDAICQRLVHAKQHITDLNNWLVDLKANKPKIYLVIMMVIFASIAWLGSLIDNLFLTYLIVVGLTMIPGLRKRGILQQGTDKIKDLIANARASKTKTT